MRADAGNAVPTGPSELHCQHLYVIGRRSISQDCLTSIHPSHSSQVMRKRFRSIHRIPEEVSPPSSFIPRPPLHVADPEPV